MKLHARTIFFIILATLSVILVYYWLTVRLSGPVKDQSIVAEAPMARPEDFSKCIIVQKDKVELRLDGIETNLSYESIKAELAKKLAGVNQLNIIYTKDADFQQVNRVLNAVIASGMKEYELKKM